MRKFLVIWRVSERRSFLRRRSVGDRKEERFGSPVETRTQSFNISLLAITGTKNMFGRLRMNQVKYL
jgi:hypothetical protein